MASAVTRILTLIALLLMPLGMGTAPALAAPVEHAALVDHASSPAGHCGEQQDQEEAPAPKKMDCAAACTAIPPASAAEPAALLKPTASRTNALMAPYTGIVLEIATPPPRLA